MLDDGCDGYSGLSWKAMWRSDTAKLRQCVGCGEMFQPRSPSHRSCTRACLLAHRDRPKQAGYQRARAAAWADPEYRARVSQSIKATHPKVWTPAQRARYLLSARYQAAVARAAMHRTALQQRLDARAAYVARVVALYADHSLSQIARIVGRDQAGLSRLLRRHGVTMRPRGRSTVQRWEV